MWDEAVKELEDVGGPAATGEAVADMVGKKKVARSHEIGGVTQAMARALRSRGRTQESGECVKGERKGAGPG